MSSKHASAANAQPSPEGVAGARLRTCVGCQGQEDARNPDVLLRLILGPGGEVAVELAQGGRGRGAYVHPAPSCLVSAATRGLPRAARSSVTLAPELSGEPSSRMTPEGLSDAVVRSMDRRIEGLLASAVRVRAVALGADAVVQALRGGHAHLVLVACDAAAAAELAEVRAAVAEGRAVSWGSKASLARCLSPGRERTEGLGVVAIASESIAYALRGAVHIRDTCLSVRETPAAVRQTRGRARSGNV